MKFIFTTLNNRTLTIDEARAEASALLRHGDEAQRSHGRAILAEVDQLEIEEDEEDEEADPDAPFSRDPDPLDDGDQAFEAARERGWDK